jgi:hypothetical protein
MRLCTVEWDTGVSLVSYHTFSFPEDCAVQRKKSSHGISRVKIEKDTAMAVLSHQQRKKPKNS